MALSDPELTTGLGLILILLFAGLVFAVLRWQKAERAAATAANLSDGAVFVAEDGKCVAANLAAEDLLGPVVGPVVGKTLPDIMTAFAGPDSGGVLAAIAGFEQSGIAIDMLTTNIAGQPFELIGQSRGGQLRLVLRGAGLIDAELGRAQAEIAAREQDASLREIEIRALTALLANAPLVAWSRTANDNVSWSAGQLPIRNSMVTASQAAALAIGRARGQNKPPEQSERFRLEITDPDKNETAALDVIETAGPGGSRLGLAVDGSGAVAAERTLARFVRTMTETFAHLNVGLAIFDRNQTLALFNPALVEMWQTDPAWLARQPDLREIIDRLRASRRIPEMPDFHTWRLQLTNLFDDTESADYEELWHLADGSDIRVLARPHPHGSLAFVFEDVEEFRQAGHASSHSGEQITAPHGPEIGASQVAPRKQPAVQH